MVNLTVMSHVVVDDKCFYLNDTYYLPNQLGGPISFSSLATEQLKISTRCITSFGLDLPKDHLNYLSSLSHLKICNNQSKLTTRFHHDIYASHRVLRILEEANNIDNYIAEFDPSKACLLSPVFHEVTGLGVSWIRDNYDLIAMDVQGFIRDKDNNNKIIPNNSKDQISAIIHQGDFVKFSFKEAKNFTGKDSLPRMFSSLPQNNVQIITLGIDGLAYSDHGKCYTLRAELVKEIDPTGAGDVFLAGFIANYLRTEELDISLAVGMALASESVKYQGVNPLPDIDYEKKAENILSTKASF